MLRQISASAGSGKTYTLTRHFLSLLKGANRALEPSGCVLSLPDDGYPRQYGIGEIMAATFTNKAATEMKNRIIGALKADAINARLRRPEAASAEELWLSAIFRHYSQLNVRTIDSLLSLLVRLSALELDLPPDFQPSFKAEEYFTPAYDGLMEDLTAWRQGFTAEFFTTDGDTLLHCLEEACRSLVLLADVKGFRPGNRLRHSLLELVHRIFRQLPMPMADGNALRARLHDLHDEFVGASAFLARAIRDEGLAASSHLLKFLDKCPGTAVYAGPSTSTMMAKEGLDGCLNKASKGMASCQAQTAFLSLVAAYEAYRRELPMVKSALQLGDLIPLAVELHERVTRHLRRSGLLPAILLPVLARTILSGEFGVSDALCRMGTRLTHMLLDEFQDTSVDQWQAIMPLALECLSHGGSITYVGDVKQAIYGWRGGDASLFDSVVTEDELLYVAPSPQRDSLPCNWRSSKAVISHNNAFFSLLADNHVAYAVLENMLPKETPEQYIRQAAEAVSKVYAGSSQQLPPGSDELGGDAGMGQGRVALYTVEAVSSSAMERLLRDRLKTLFTEELPARHTFGDIAVLVRSGDEERLLASWLTDWAIPVVTENSFLLSSHPLVGRLVSFLTFIDYPFDDLSFWEFITGPECFGRVAGLDRPTLETWAASLGHRSGIPLFRLFRSAFPAEWKRLIEPFYNQAGLMSAYDLLMEVIRRYELLDTDAAPFLRRMLEVAHLAESRGLSSLAAFLDFWKQAGFEEKLPLPDSMDAVRIMTIHKAKGLEFPVVVIPFHHRGKRRDPELAEATVGGQKVLARAGKEQPETYYPACITDELERLNLLYVAWTRPVLELHAFITRPKGVPTPLMKGLAVLLEHYRERHEGLCAFEEVTPENAQICRGTPSDIISSSGQGHGSPPKPRPSAPCPAENIPLEKGGAPVRDRAYAEQPPSMPPQAAPCSGKTPQTSERYLPADTAWYPMNWLPRLKIYRSNLEDISFSSRQRGIFIHLGLEYLLLTGDVAMDVDRAVKQALYRFPLPMDAPDALADEARECLRWFSALPQAGLWLKKGLREQAVIDAAGNTHRVDLLVNDGRMLHAVDYKTGEADAEAHIRQVRRYMVLASEALGLPARGYLVYLDQRRVVEVAP